jgi:uncharacterized protein YdiU (UPF0061 family)
MFGGSVLFDAWLERWRRRRSVSAPAMNRVNPIYIPRNHLVEAALGSATDGDVEPVHRLLDVLADPFTQRADLEEYAAPAPGGSSGYRTYCGT